MSTLTSGANALARFLTAFFNWLRDLFRAPKVSKPVEHVAQLAIAEASLVPAAVVNDVLEVVEPQPYEALPSQPTFVETLTAAIKQVASTYLLPQQRVYQKRQWVKCNRRSHSFRPRLRSHQLSRNAIRALRAS